MTVIQGRKEMRRQTRDSAAAHKVPSNETDRALSSSAGETAGLAQSHKGLPLRKGHTLGGRAA
jgi:hypothetical protein